MLPVANMKEDLVTLKNCLYFVIGIGARYATCAAFGFAKRSSPEGCGVNR